MSFRTVALLLLCCGLSSASIFTISDRNVTTGHATAVQKILTNTATGENVTIITNYGGRVESLFLLQPSNKRVYDVLLSNNGNATAMLSTSGYRGLMLLPYANRIANATYVWNGTRYYLPVNEPARNNSIHGLLYDRPMDLVSQTASNTEAVLKLSYMFGSDPGYPFPLQVVLSYSLSASGLTITVSATNRDPSWPLPFYSSFHSYFNVRDESISIVQFDPCTTWNHIMVSNNSNLYSDQIPTGQTDPAVGFDGKTPIGGTKANPTYWDDEYKSKSTCVGQDVIRTRITDQDIHAVLWGDSSYRYIQIFSGAATRFNAQAVAIEAMNGKCDAFNNFDGLHELSGGETYVGTFGIHLE